MNSCAETYKLSSFIKTHNPSSDKNPTLTSDKNSPKVSGRISHAYLLELAEKLIAFRTLSLDEYESLISFYDKEVTDLLTNEAKRIREGVYGTTVYIRGLIEISNYCKNDCLYCGIRKSNHSCTRYRLTPQDILECACEGYRLGFRTTARLPFHLASAPTKATSACSMQVLIVIFYAMKPYVKICIASFTLKLCI